jgi:transglutaminase-like putative cysteine protease
MDGTPARTVALPSGDAGVAKTLVNMQRLADSGSRDPAVRAAVVNALRTSAAAAHNLYAQTVAWFTFVRDWVYFVNDPTGTEYLQSPAVTLQIMSGDCDDRATLLAAGLRSIGVPAQFKAVAADPTRPGTFSHVYVVARVPGPRGMVDVPLDPTYPDNSPGTEPPYMARQWRVPA